MGTADDASGPELAAWDVALRVGREAARFATPLDARTRHQLDTDFDEATARAEELVEAATGLRSTAGRARGIVLDRGGWVEANIGSLRRLLAPASRVLAESVPGGRGLVSPVTRAAAGVEFGVLLTWMSRRVLGQYDLMPLDGDDSGGFVYYVGPNVVALERRHGFAPREFRLWIALHEVTHRVQFTGVEWMRPYFLGLVERGTAFGVPDVRAVLESLRRAAAELWEGRNPLAEAGVVGLIASSDQLATLREAQALMSLLEGHGEFVMSRAGAGEVKGGPRFAAVLEQRRASAKGVARLVQQALGLDAKLRQYSAGRRFIDAVEASGGDELFSRIWRSPEMLPTLEEIGAPARWIARVGGTTVPRS
ncbi:MAG TPA: zinc-dependent metalloprotease [Acidimicrobiales bacterium]|nr:zinc-dependent metalloprotease [Acidimicrobiales bacterium]